MAWKRDCRFFSCLMVFMVVCISVYLFVLGQPTRHGGTLHQRQLTDENSRLESPSMLSADQGPARSDQQYQYDYQSYLLCTGKKRIVLLKNHKVGGDTVKNILNRYGYNRNLTFLIPRNFAPSGAYPYNLNSETVFERPPNKTFDIWVHHAIFERDLFKSYFPDDTVFLTILRNPLSHFKSTWNHYQLRKKFHIPVTRIDSIRTFLSKPAKYDSTCGHGQHEPLCLTQNPMSVDLGFPVQYNQRLQSMKNHTLRETMTQEFVQKIQEDFPLVMIMEYFDESLVLLRRMMCWSMKHILYYSVNSKKYSYKHVEITGKDKERHVQWNYVDYALYDHFNKTFWRKVKKTGNGFFEEVEFFRQVNLRMREHCNALIVKGEPCSRYGGTIEVSDTRWGPGFTIDQEFCLLARRGLRCHFTLQAERLSRDLGMKGTGLQRSPVTKVDAELNRYCNFCEHKVRCNRLDYLTHFYRDGHINARQYHGFKKFAFSGFTQTCSLPKTMLRPEWQEDFP